MADFLPAFERTLQLEGGYKLHTVKDDKGGMTFAGIARNYHPNWPGWAVIDGKGDASDGDVSELTGMVRQFYLANFWNPLRASEINDQAVANHIYDYGVNAGPKSAVKMLQLTLGLTPDGVIGPKTLERINGVNADFLILAFAFAKIVRYVGICNKDRSQDKFLRGWLNRTINGVV